MTYALAQPLQAAVYHRLMTDPALQAIVEGHVYDQVPPGARPSIYVALGPETVRDRSDATGRGAEHDFLVTIVTDAAGFSDAKAAAAAVSDALLAAPLPLARGRLGWLGFRSARAGRRPGADDRQIDLTFRARVEDDLP